MIINISLSFFWLMYISILSVKCFISHFWLLFRELFKFERQPMNIICTVKNIAFLNLLKKRSTNLIHSIYLNEMARLGWVRLTELKVGHWWLFAAK